MMDLRELAKIWVGKSKKRQDDFLLGAQWAMRQFEGKVYEMPLMKLEPIVAMKNLRLTEQMTKAMRDMAKVYNKTFRAGSEFPVQTLSETAKKEGE